MKQTNNSIFTRVLALMLCLIMVVGTLSACFNDVDINNGLDTETNTDTSTNTSTNTTTTTTTTTGDSAENNPVEDPVDPNEIFYASATLENVSLLLGTLTTDVVIGNEMAGALVPSDVKIENGAASLALSVKNVEDLGDIDLGDAELVQNLDVHINGVATDNTVPMIVNLGAVLEAGLGNTELKLYHIENGSPVLMMRVNDASDFAIHNQYVYNSETGEVSIYVASFSIFSVVKLSADVWDGEAVAEDFASGTGTENDPYIINTAAQLVYFRNQVDAGVTFQGQFIKLNKDIDLADHLFDPIGFGYTYNKDSDTAFMGTFDGGNHTIYNLYQNGWELEYDYSTAGGGLFASIEGSEENPVTIENLVVSGANIVMECIDMGVVVGYAQGVCHFENIVVTDSTIANYNRATGGVVGEVCYGPYGTDVTGEKYSHTFKNIVVDSSVVVSSLWGSFDTLCGGVIGGKWGDATVKMDNVIVAAELDVYSDVTAAYQWYAYRRAGMLIGHTEQNSPKSALNADAPFLTCENVKVYYGDWVNYNYYEFADQDNDTGKRYPWVRAEESPVGNNGAFSNPRYGVPTYNGVTVNNENKDTYKTGYAAITFNQLYGGGQGVYGCAEHAGVTTNSKEFKTIYVHNNLGWTNLKLQYWFANGNDTWTTIIDGIDMNNMLVEGIIYKIQLPATVSTFKIVADGEESDTFVLADIEDKSNVNLGVVSCEHEYDNACDTTCNVCGAEREITHTPGDAATCTTAQTCTVCKAVIKAALGHTEVTDKAVAATCTTAGKTEGSHCSVCNTVLVAQTTVAALGHTWNINTHKCLCGEEAETKTIYFQNNWQWANVYVYYWYADDTQISGEVLSYPGAKLTTSTKDGSYQLYQITVPEYAEGFIISNGVDRKTIDLKYDTVTNSYLYYMVWDGKDGDGVDNVQSFEYKPGYTAVFFQNNWKWTKVSAYYWGSTKVSNPSWPGNSMTKVGKDGNKTYDVYVYYIPNDIVGLIIDGLKDGSTSTRDQTPDITSGWYNGICYYMDWVNNANKVQNKHISEIGCQ